MNNQLIADALRLAVLGHHSQRRERVWWNRAFSDRANPLGNG